MSIEPTIPFGKFRGWSLTKLFVAKPTYLLRLLSQDWARQRYPDLCRAILALGPELLSAIVIPPDA